MSSTRSGGVSSTGRLSCPSVVCVLSKLTESLHTTCLHRISIAFKHSDIKFCTLHGDMSIEERTLELARFRDSDDIDAFVVSIDAGAVGLNMTCADEVYLMVRRQFLKLIMPKLTRCCLYFRMPIGIRKLCNKQLTGSTEWGKRKWYMCIIWLLITQLNSICLM